MIRFITNLIQALIGLIISLFFASCHHKIEINDVFSTIEGSETKISENRQLSGFDKIKVGQAIDVELFQTDGYEVIVEGNENIMPHLLTEVNGGELSIHYDKTFKSFKNVEAKVKIKMPKLTKIKTSSASSVKTINLFTGENLQINASSASSVKLNIEYDDLAANASSAASINLKGMSISSQYEASSAATINTKDLKTNDIKAKASSAGIISTFPLLKLNAKSSSGGIVEYYNEPKDDLVKKSSSGGNISKN